MKKLLMVLMLTVSFSASAVSYDIVDNCYAVSDWAADVMNQRQKDFPATQLRKDFKDTPILINLIETVYNRPKAHDVKATVYDFRIEILTECLTKSSP